MGWRIVTHLRNDFYIALLLVLQSTTFPLVMLDILQVGVYCSLTQLLDSGFYHADPHPGNLLRTPDGKLAYLGI